MASLKFLCVEGTLQKANDYHSILVKKIIVQNLKQNVSAIKEGNKHDRKLNQERRELISPREF